MDWNDFEASARRVIPQQDIKPNRCWIGVLSHEKGPQDTLEEADFVWMIGHHKIPIQKIHDTYQKRHENVNFELKFKDALVEKSDTVRSFLPQDCGVILFLACLPDQLDGVGSHSHHPPSSPVVRRVKDEPHHDNLLCPRNLSNLFTDRPNITAFAQDQYAGTPMRSASMAQPLLQKATKFNVESGAPILSAPQSGTTSNVISKDPLPQLDGVPVKDEYPSHPVLPSLMDCETQAAFDPESFFHQESSMEQASQEEVTPADRSIREIMPCQDAHVLEAGVAKSMQVLQNLKSIFARYPEHQDALAWSETIDKLIPQAQRKRTVVGVVGNTGAGKSSVINAMLDEERLVPTNCMRACTAVVTEMSWNASTDPSMKYHAEIEFISHDDWRREVMTLMKEFLTENGGIAREVSDENSDAGIAWAKFHSVYPKRTRESLADCTVDSLLSDRSVLAVLDTTKTINTAYPDLFYRQLQRYVDSKEKVTKKGKDKEKDKLKNTFEMEYWPLIKVVKIYVKAPALSTGAVIVDLPGVHDSNAARAAVAQGYMKQCTGLWIVAPVNRAVDDKAAKNLLGETFKRQLKYDGGFSSVTFICSKTDDISITEAIDTLELEDEVEHFYEQQRSHERQIDSLQERIDELKESQDVYRIAQKQTSSDIETWEELKEHLEDGRTVYAPKPKRSKRKKSQPKQGDGRKRRQKARDDSEDDFIASSDEGDNSDGDSTSDDDVRAPQDPLSEDDIKAKIKELREAKKGARRKSLELGEQIKELKPEIVDLKAKIGAIKADISHICIAGRNDYSKRAIQQDFAAGLKELDQENAAEEDEEHFNPDEELRDYEEVARSLPVFCVSSRAYQKMCGRLQKDDTVPGFKNPEETEMPQLQSHCRKITEAGRIQTARTFLLSMCQLLTAFSLWAFDDGTGLKMTDDDKRKQVKYLEKRLGELELGLEEAVRACLNVLKKEMNEQIFDRYPDLINEAINAAPDTAQKWGAHRAEGGLVWGTYKAIVRRDGQYQSSTAGHRDFNADLVSPIIKKLATSWERAFQNRLPKAFEAFIKDSGKLLHSFHHAIEDRARSNGVGLANLAALKTQIFTYEQLFADLNQVLIARMTELQREANRDFTPTVANIMHTVYEMCADEHGPGSFKRMKAHMTDYVDQYRKHMFHDATQTVKRHLESMCKALEEVMEEKADEIFIKMKADYTRVLGGRGQVHFDQDAVLPKSERALRSDVLEFLKSVDAQFEPIARGEIEQEAMGDVTNAAKEEERSLFDNDDEESAFESAHESYPDANDESIIEGFEDTMITKPTPSKHLTTEVWEKENRGPLTPNDDDMYVAEEV